MSLEIDSNNWDFSSAIELLKSLSLSLPETNPDVPAYTYRISRPDRQNPTPTTESLGLGDFSDIWRLLSSPQDGPASETEVRGLDGDGTNKGVRWRDESNRANQEDDVRAALNDIAASVRTRKRAERRARARVRAEKHAADVPTANWNVSETPTDPDSGEELERLRRSPDRKAVIQSMLGRPATNLRDNSSPPTSPSPPKGEVPVLKREWPISNPFQWSTGLDRLSSSHKIHLTPVDGLEPKERKARLIARLIAQFPQERRYLSTPGLVEPAFTSLNVSKLGIHVFVDISNVRST